MTNVLAPYLKQQFFANGVFNAGGLVFTYAAGTSTPIATYTATGATNTNPVILNSRGEADIWMIPNIGYKIVLQDAVGNQIWSVDNIINSVLLTLYGGVDTGAVNAYVVNFPASFTALSNGIILYFTAATTNIGSSTLSVNGLSILGIVTQATVPIPANTIIAGQTVGVMYYNGQWVLLSTPAQVPSQGTFIGPLTGFAAPPTPTVKWLRSGNKVTLYIGTTATATSNSTAMTMTGLPLALQPTTLLNLSCFVQLLDNTVTQLGVAFVSAGTGTITFGVGAGGGAFTAAGVKGLPAGCNINYDLS